MPPSNYLEGIAKHILALLDEISSMKSQLNTPQSESLSFEITEMREDVHDVKLLLCRVFNSTAVSMQTKKSDLCWAVLVSTTYVFAKLN